MFVRWRDVSRVSRALAFVCLGALVAPGAAYASSGSQNSGKGSLNSGKGSLNRGKSQDDRQDDPLEREVVPGRVRVIVMLQPGADPSEAIRELGGRIGRRFRYLNAIVVDLPAAQVRKLQ